MTYQEAILEQTVETQRRSDKLLGRDKMGYDEFCNAVDEIIPSEMMTMKDGKPLANMRETNKVIGKYIKDTTGMPYYEIYLSMKYNLPLR